MASGELEAAAAVAWAEHHRWPSPGPWALLGMARTLVAQLPA